MSMITSCPAYTDVIKACKHLIDSEDGVSRQQVLTYKTVVTKGEALNQDVGKAFRKLS